MHNMQVFMQVSFARSIMTGKRPLQRIAEAFLSKCWGSAGSPKNGIAIFWRMSGSAVGAVAQLLAQWISFQVR